MDAELRELFQQIILGHNADPFQFYPLEKANIKSTAYNPLCGDNYQVYVEFNDDVIQDISFTGSGCAISKAATSLLCKNLKGKSKKEAQSFIQAYFDLISKGERSDDIDYFGELIALEGVKNFPTRQKCATLSWQALHEKMV